MTSSSESLKGEAGLRRYLTNFEIWAPLLLYSILTLACFWPVLPKLTGELLGPPEDNMQFYWFMWHGSRALTDASLPLMHTRFIYFPEGISLYYANYFYLGVFAAAGLKSLLPLPLIFNLLLFASFVFAGWGAYALARFAGIGRPGSILAGMIFAFNPSHGAHAEHHITIASIQFFPWFLLFFLKARRTQSVPWTMAASAALVANAWCDWNYWLYTLVFLVGAYLWSAWREKKIGMPSELRILVWITVPAAAALSFWIVPMLRISAEHAGTEVYLPGQDRYAVDLLGFMIPGARHGLASWEPVRAAWGKILAGSTEWEKVSYLGWVNLILVASQAKRFGKAIWPWMIGLLLCYALALGSELHVLGRSFLIPMPYEVFEAIPVLKHARNPARIFVWGYLFWAVITGMAFDRLESRLRKNSKKIWVLLGVGLLSAADFVCPFYETTPVRLPAGYEKLLEARRAGESFAILSIPWDGGRYMLYQTLHGIPDLQGYVGRKYGMSLIGKIPFDPERLAVQKAILRKYHVKFVLFHKKKRGWDSLKREDWGTYVEVSARVREYEKVYAKVFEDADTTIFKVY